MKKYAIIIGIVLLTSASYSQIYKFLGQSKPYILKAVEHCYIFDNTKEHLAIKCDEGKNKYFIFFEEHTGLSTAVSYMINADQITDMKAYLIDEGFKKTGHDEYTKHDVYATIKQVPSQTFYSLMFVQMERKD